MKQKFPKTVKDLIKQGEDDGFLVQDDILLAYPEPEKHIDAIDEFFDEVFRKGIDIFETISTREETEAHKSTEEIGSHRHHRHSFRNNATVADQETQ